MVEQCLIVVGRAVPKWCVAVVERLSARTEADIAVSPCGHQTAASAAERVAAVMVAHCDAVRAVPLQPRAGGGGPYAIVVDLRPCAALHAGERPEATWYYRVGSGSAAYPFVHEVAAGTSVMRVELRERSCGGDRLVAAGQFGRHQRYARTVNDALFDAAEWPAREIVRPLRDRPGAPPSPVRDVSPLLLARFAYAAAGRRVRHFVEMFFVEAVWNVGVVEAPPSAFLAPNVAPPTRWYASRHGTRVWIADPMVASDGEHSVVLVERFDRAIGRGTLAALPIDDPAAEPAPVLERKEHLSYPSVLRHDGALYLIPECHESGGVPVYRSTAFPHDWELVDVMRPVPDLLDPTIFEHDGRWWLLGTRQNSSPNTNLFVWHGPAPHGPWTAHARNPVKTDVTSSRPAGPVFVHAGALYRPSQDCARSYGAAITISRIDRLTPDDFEETVTSRVMPFANTPYRDGIHTLCATPDGRCVVDGKRHVIAPWRPLTALVHRFTRRRAAAAARVQLETGTLTP